MASALIIVGVVATAFVGLVVPPVYQRAVTLGATRSQIHNIHGSELKVIPETVACEDLHYDPVSAQLYTSCQTSNIGRSAWFPPLLKFDVNASKIQGTIVVVDPQTFTPKVLKYTNFDGPLIPHGIEILSDPVESSSTLIFVVNHLSNPEYYESPQKSKIKALERIEIFRHTHGSDEVTHIRSVQHPLIQTANDIAATGPNSFYVTNDHHYAEGLLRVIEEFGDYHLTPWSDTLHVEFDSTQKDPTAGVVAEVVLTGLHNNNGLGHGRAGYPEILVVDASGGRLSRVTPQLGSRALRVLETIQLDTTLDNPFYYHDKYATRADNASGYILPGLTRAVTLGPDFANSSAPTPSSVWHVRSNDNAFDFESSKNVWEKRIIFQDDGRILRSASGAVLLGIDPATNGGKKEGWLWVTGFGSDAMIATKIAL